ncbi:MAG TPA: BMP family ABC transporter substrate-binding protein [Polyangia bacterium]|nr:BMP family ABC transporter substrate-binding protein [Polyangia bacterium]
MRRLAAYTIALLVIDLLLLLPGRRAARPTVASGQALRVGLVFDVGGRGDKSFNDSAYRGLDRAVRELGVEPEYIEPGEGSDRESGIRLLAAKGFDLIIGVGFIFSDDLFSVAKEYPRVKFACVDYAKFDAHGFVVPPPNMVALKFREEEGSFLTGALAALTSKTGVVGFVGGMDIPLIHKFEAGYKAGVAAVCESCRVLTGYAGVTGDAFKNPAKGKELALAQYGARADVVFHAAGSTGLGVFEAARELGRFAIGVDADQFGEAPGRVLTSMTKQVDVSVFDTVRDLQKGKWEGGVRVFGLKENGVDYVYDEHNRALIPDAVRERVEMLRRKIIAGEIVVPSEVAR